MNKDMVDLVSKFELIRVTGNYKRIITDATREVLEMLKQMNVTDIIEVTDSHIDVNYVMASRAQKEALFNIEAARKRFCILEMLNNAGGVHTTDAEQKFFDDLNKEKQRVAMAAAANVMKQNA